MILNRPQQNSKGKTNLPSTVAIDAAAKESKRGPQRCTQSLKSAPNKIKGVANCKDNSCSDLAAMVPPGLRIPIDANPNVNAMAVTGGPNRRPMRVVVPMTCAMVAVPVSAATLPQVSAAPIQGRVGIIDDSSVLYLVVLREFAYFC